MTRRLWSALGLVLSLSACSRDEPRPLVVLIAVDGATPETISRLRSEGRVPNLERLASAGVLTPMESLAARRRLRPRPRRGYWSPIVWASMATGQVPDKHGIVDFLLPVPGTELAWIGTESGAPHGEIRLPEIQGRAPFRLHLRLRSYEGAQTARVALNGRALAGIEVTPAWAEFDLDVPEGAPRRAENRLTLTLERQSRPSDRGASGDDRPLAAALAEVRVTDADGTPVVRFDPVLGRFDLLSGFHQPEAKVVEAQSTHLRARPVWDLLGESGHPVGVVGYWNTWPAQPVNGFLVSSHLGVRGERLGSDTSLTWPAELIGDIEALAPTDDDMGRLIREFYPDACTPLEPAKTGSFEKILRQDAYYHRIARKLLPTLDSGFFTVYYESIDASGHLFLPLATGAPVPDGCPDEVRDVVDRSYERVDQWIGELVEGLPDHATVIVASDHGMAPGGDRGLHAPFGIFVARGPGFRPGAEPRGLTILDVAPTILHAMGEPIPLDIDGAVAVGAFDAAWLEDHPPRYSTSDASLAPGETAEEEIPEELLERLRALGYLQ